MSDTDFGSFDALREELSNANWRPYSIYRSATGLWWAHCNRCPHFNPTRTKASAQAAAEIHEKTHKKESSR